MAVEKKWSDFSNQLQPLLLRNRRFNIPWVRTDVEIPLMRALLVFVDGLLHLPAETYKEEIFVDASDCGAVAEVKDDARGCIAM